MMTTFRVSVDSLDERFVESLREKYPHASLEIKVDAGSRPDALSEEQFWELIELLDWRQAGDSNAIIEPVVAALAQGPLHYIFEFQDRLSQKLFLLDTRRHAAHTGENAYTSDENDENQYFSTDEFLYARCCVVANGKDFFEKVLLNPRQMPEDMAFEALLRIARLAYQRKTGQPFRYVPAFNYETFSNREGWK